jgi:hypothetical protein
MKVRGRTGWGGGGAIMRYNDIEGRTLIYIMKGGAVNGSKQATKDWV